MTLIDVDIDLALSLVETVALSLDTLHACIDEPGDVRELAIRAATAATHGLSIMTGGWVGELEAEIEELTQPVATDDPATCGHPRPHFDLPGSQKMCRSCGASEVGDGIWTVL